MVRYCRCGDGGQCYVSNDGIDAFSGTLTITNVNFAECTQVRLLAIRCPALHNSVLLTSIVMFQSVVATKPLDLAAGPATTEFFKIDECVVA